MKSLIRKRSAPASRLQRALSSKSLRSTSIGADDRILGTKPAVVGEDVCDRAVSVENDAMSPQMASTPAPTATEVGGGSPSKRQFIMESAVQFTVALQCQERHLFLFSDMLLVAKARSGGNFKLKDKLRLSEMWLAECIDDVTEVSKDASTSFVLGWPTTNVVATFSRPAARDLWYNKLSQMIAEERQLEPKNTTIQVVFSDHVNNIDFCKTLSVDSSMTARDCVRMALSNVDTGSGSGTPPSSPSAVTAAEYQLWTRIVSSSGNDQSPYPLIGHELPFAIKMNFLRELAAEDGHDLLIGSSQSPAALHATANCKCQFILRHAHKSLLRSPTADLSASAGGGKKQSQQQKKATRKSPIRIHNVFRRSSNKSDSVDSAVSTCSTGLLFGQPLTRLCQHEPPLPKPVLDMLMQLFLVGPFTVGIFRKSANARLIREMREKLDTEPEVNMASVNICVVACLMKDFLRSLPDAVLGSDLYNDWRQLADVEDQTEKVQRVRELCARLSAANVALLCHFLCVLHHIAARSRHNLMTAANLAVCVGPSLLAPGNPAHVMTAEHSKLLPAVVEFLIDKCALIFGSDMLQLFGPPPDKELRPTDSGAEESDSVNSSGGGVVGSSGGVRRDDSSIDSLERELLGDSEPLPRKDKMSVTNLSRDSGLTMSDTQLYTADDETEESASNSSGHSGGPGVRRGGASGACRRTDKRATDSAIHSAYSSGRGPTPSFPPAGNPGAIYAAVYRRRLGQTFSSPAVATPPVDSTSGLMACADDQITGQLSAPCASSTAVYSHVPVTRPVIHGSNFQRQDWTRQRHLLRRSGHGVSSCSSSTSSSGGGKSSTAVSPSAVVGRLLRRSNSEESLLNDYCHISRITSAGSSVTRITGSPAATPATFSASQCPVVQQSPQQIKNDAGGASVREHQLMPRSRSAHQIVEKRWSRLASTGGTGIGNSVADWSRSRSTTAVDIDEVDGSFDSSTLSDDDSTPHMSRSNSRSHELALANDLWERAYGSGGGSGVINPVTSMASASAGVSTGGGCSFDSRSDSGSYSSRADSMRSSRTGSFSTVRSATTVRSVETASSCAATLAGVYTPPSYEATLSRRGLVQHKPALTSSVLTNYHHHSGFNQQQQHRDSATLSQRHLPEPDCPPLPPKSDVPPLPPKQKTPLKRLCQQMTAGNGSAVAAATRQLQQLTATHRLSGGDWSARSGAAAGAVYVQPSGGGDMAPALPPKERTVIHIEPETDSAEATSATILRPARLKRQVARREAHTQTEHEIEPQAAPSSSTGVSVRQPHVTLVEVEAGAPATGSRTADLASAAVGPSERRGRNRRRDRQAALRARSHTSLNTACYHDVEHAAVSDQAAAADEVHRAALPETRLEWSPVAACRPDSSLPEISWSVSKLRAMFSATDGGSTGSGPSAIGCHRRLHRTSAVASTVASLDDLYSLPAFTCRASSTSCSVGDDDHQRSSHRRRRSDSAGSAGSSNCGEESYV